MFGGILDFIFPPRCGGCRRAGTWFCAACAATATAPILSLCPACHRWTSVHPCPLCPTSGWRPASIRGLLRLEGPVQEAIHRLKYRNRPRLAEPLASLALQLAASSPMPLTEPPVASLVLAVPLHPHRQRQRGYNQAEAVAQALTTSRSADPVRLPGRLARPVATSPQVGRTGPDRRAAMAGAFSWTGPPPPAEIILVDDVVTTGATLLAAADALHLAGAVEVHCLALAQG